MIQLFCTCCHVWKLNFWINDIALINFLNGLKIKNQIKLINDQHFRKRKIQRIPISVSTISVIHFTKKGCDKRTEKHSFIPSFLFFIFCFDNVWHYEEDKMNNDEGVSLIFTDIEPDIFLWSTARFDESGECVSHDQPFFIRFWYNISSYYIIKLFSIEQGREHS